VRYLADINMRTFQKSKPCLQGFWLLLVLLLPVGKASGQVTSHFTAEIRIVLPKQTWVDSEEITGNVEFKLSAPPEWPLQEKPSATLNHPRVMLRLPQEFSASPVDVTFSTPLPNTMRIGSTYHVSFRIAQLQHLKAGLPTGLGATQLFQPGKHKLGVDVHCASPGWRMPPDGQWPDVSGEFKGAPQSITILPSDAKSLTKEQVLAVLQGDVGGARWDVLQFYSENGLLVPNEVLKLLATADPLLRGNLARRFGGEDIPLQNFNWFTNQTSIVLHDQEPTPFFIRLPKGAPLEIAFAGTNTHNCNAQFSNQMLLPYKSHYQIKASPTPGVYQARCDMHNHVWGWLLVTEQ
jgi:hypothetical protein